MLSRKCVDGGVGTGTPGAASGGGPGGQGKGADPDTGGGGGAGAGTGSPVGGGSSGAGDPGSGVGATSKRVTKCSVTAGSSEVDGCREVDAVTSLGADTELGAVGVFCSAQDAIVNAASERTIHGTIKRSDVSDMWLLLRTRRVSRSSVPTPIHSQKVSHELKR